MRIGQNSAIHFVSQLAASLLGFAATLYLARELGSETLGAYFVIIAVLTWLKIVGGMGIVTALRKRLSEAGSDGPYLAAGILIQTAFFVLIAAALFAARGAARSAVDTYLRGVGVPVVIALLAVALWLQFVTAVLDGQHKVHLSSLLTPIDRLVRSGVQVAIVILGYALGGLLFGYGVAALVAAMVGVGFMRRRLARPEREHVADLLSYAQFSWLGTLSSRAFASMDTLVLGLFVADGLIGVYEIAWNLASILAVFGTSISTALFPEMSKQSDENGPEVVGDLVTDGLRYSGLFLLPGLVGAIVIGDRVLAVYGGEFSRGHLVLVVLIVARLVHAYGAQFVNALNAVDRPELAFRVNGVFVLVNTALNVGLISAFGWIGAAVATTVSAIITLTLGYRAATDLIPLRLPLRGLATQTTAAVAMGAVIAAGRGYVPGGIPWTILLVFGGATIYVATLLGISRDFRTVVRTNLPAIGR